MDNVIQKVGFAYRAPLPPIDDGYKKTYSLKRMGLFVMYFLGMTSYIYINF